MIMTTKAEEHLRFLYGESAAAEIYSRLVEYWREHGFEANCAADGERNLLLSQRDVLLITYADQVQEVGVARLKTLGNFLKANLSGVVSGVHILPFYPSSSDDGFSVIDWFAVSTELGEWEDIHELASEFELMFDGVFNHVSAKGEWFKEFLKGEEPFRDFFLRVDGDPDLSQVVRPRTLPLLTEFKTAFGPENVWTTFSADQVDLNFKNPEVLLAMVEALLFYVANGARFIRLDAIAYLWKEIGTSCIHLPQTHRVVQLLRAVLDEVASEVMLITETNVPHTDNISYFGDGTNEAQLVYNFALPPLVLHSLATGDADDLTRWASSLELPSGGTAFFNFLASHDGIGVNAARGILSDEAIEVLVARTRAHGGYVSYKTNADGSKSPYELNINYFDALSNPNNRAEPLDTQVNRFMAAQAIMLALAGMPGIYFHSLFGSRNNRIGVETSGQPRRINREKLTLEDLNRELKAPGSLRARVFLRYRQMLQTRREQAAFHPRSGQQVLEAGKEIFALLRGHRVLCLHNVTDRTACFDAEKSGLPPDGRWIDLLSGQRHAATDGKLTIPLAPYQVIWARLAND